MIAAWCALGLLLVATPLATALTRKQANRIALHALGVAKAKQSLIVFGLPRPLPQGADVIEAGGGPAAKRTQYVRRGLNLVGVTKLRRKRLAHRTWLFWEDRVPYALFQHPSLLLLVDDRTGRVVRRQPETFYPLVNGHVPAFIPPAGYARARYRVFSNVSRVRAPARRTTAGTGHEAGAPASARGSSWDRAVAVTALTGPPDLHDSCLVTIGYREDSLFAGDFKLAGQIASELHLDKTDATDADDLQAKVTAAVTRGCKDVVIMIAAHGYAARGSNYTDNGNPVGESDHAQVLLRYKTGLDASGNDVITTSNLDAVAVRQIMARFPKVGFKLVISACFSGRWTELDDQPNLRFIATSAASDQFGFGYHTPRDQNGLYYAYSKGSQSNAVVTNTSDTLINQTTNTTHATEFMNGILRALDDWAHSDSQRGQTGNDLAKALAVAFKNESANDFAAQLGVETPKVDDHSDRMPDQAPPAPGGQPGCSSPFGCPNNSLSCPSQNTCTFGSPLDKAPNDAEQDPVDTDWFQMIINYLQKQGTAQSAAVSGQVSQAIPLDGQIVTVRIKGIALASGRSGDPGPLTQIHFQDLRPQPDGSYTVIVSSEPENIPSSGDPNQVTTYHPVNLCVRKGDYLTLSTEGGFDPTFYPNGVPFQIFATSSGSSFATYSKHNGVGNGANFTPTPVSDKQLLMQWDLATAGDATALCAGGTKTG